MKNLKLNISIALLLPSVMALSGQQITLVTCIDSALTNKGNIMAVKTDVEVAKLDISAAWQKYLPDLSASYNYRYNPLIPTQIIPIGQFSPVPTDEKRPVRFGTNWQQTAGISIYQPIIDFTINSRVEESRINEKMKNTDAESAEKDLMAEVLKSFTNIWLYQERLRYAALDTLRTFRTKELIMAKSGEGRSAQTDINRAVMNHNNALSDYHGAMSALAGEKIYMSYLTGISLETMIDGNFDFSPFSEGMIDRVISGPVPDSVPSVKNLMLKEQYLRQQQKSELAARIPTVGIEGYLGANQYTDTFNPALAGSWYGNSYVGLSIKLSIISGTNNSNRIRQLKLQEQGVRSALEDEISFRSANYQKLTVEMKQFDYQVRMAQENIRLYEENIALDQQRFEAGQISSYDLLTEEIDLRKEIAGFNEKQAQLAFKKIELLSNSGRVYSFLDSLN